MKRNTTRLFSGLTIILCLIFAFALTVAAQTGLSKDQVKIGETVNVSLDVPSGAWVTAWSCTPYGALSFSATTNTGTTYKTVATAVKPGEITVRATVKYADNTTSTVTVGTLLAVLEDGIYTVGNDYADDYYSQSGAFYLRSQITYPTSGGLYVAQHSQNNFGDITNRIYNYWYIEHQGSGQYTIRSVADENKALTYSGSTFSLSTIGSNVTTAAKWYIRGENIIPVSATTKCLALNSPTPTETYHTDGNPYYYFDIQVNTIGGISIENWSFEKSELTAYVIRENTTGRIFSSLEIEVKITDTQFSLSDVGYTVVGIKNGSKLDVSTWSIQSGASTATLSINASTGKIKTKAIGEGVVLADFGNYNIFQINIVVCSGDIGIEDNESYYIMSYDSNMYLSLQNASTTNGTNVNTRLRSTANYSKWRVQKQSDSTYQIVSLYNSSDKVLNVSGTNVNIYTDSNGSNQKFTIERIDTSGYTQGLYYIRYSSYYVIEDSNFNVCLSSEASSAAVWCFSKVNKDNANMFDFKYNYTEDGTIKSYDSTFCHTKFVSDFTGLGFNAIAQTNQTATTAYNALKNTDVFVFRGHGNAGLIAFFNETSNGVATGLIIADESIIFPFTTNNNAISSLYVNDLASAKCILLLGCSTGVSIGGYNLMNSMYSRGAHFILGTSETVYTSDSDKFLEGFLDELINNSGSIESCIREGRKKAGETINESGRYPAIWIGDTRQYLN